MLLFVVEDIFFGFCVFLFLSGLNLCIQGHDRLIEVNLICDAAGVGDQCLEFFQPPVLAAQIGHPPFVIRQLFRLKLLADLKLFQ